MTSRSLSASLPLLTPPAKPRAGRREGERERRAMPRVRIEIECEERVGATRFRLITQDLSGFGLSIKGLTHPVGTRMSLALHLPDGNEPLAIVGEVVGNLATRRGMRLAFRRPPAQAVRRIHRFLARRAAR